MFGDLLNRIWSQMSDNDLRNFYNEAIGPNGGNGTLPFFFGGLQTEFDNRFGGSNIQQPQTVGIAGDFVTAQKRGLLD